MVAWCDKSPLQQQQQQQQQQKQQQNIERNADMKESWKKFCSKYLLQVWYVVYEKKIYLKKNYYFISHLHNYIL